MEDTHSEVLKRMEGILMFLSKYGGIKEEHVQLLWKYITQPHQAETHKKIAFGLLSAVISRAGMTLIRPLYLKMKDGFHPPSELTARQQWMGGSLGR